MKEKQRRLTSLQGIQLVSSVVDVDADDEAEDDCMPERTPEADIPAEDNQLAEDILAVDKHPSDILAADNLTSTTFTESQPRIGQIEMQNRYENEEYINFAKRTERSVRFWIFEIQENALELREENRRASVQMIYLAVAERRRAAVAGRSSSFFFPLFFFGLIFLLVAKQRETKSYSYIKLRLNNDPKSHLALSNF